VLLYADRCPSRSALRRRHGFLIGGTIGAMAGDSGRVAAAAALTTVHTLPAIIIVLFSVSLMGSTSAEVAAVALAIWPTRRGSSMASSSPCRTGIRAAARPWALDLCTFIFREICQRLADVIVQVSPMQTAS